MGWFLAACGVFAISGAAFDWEWFMNNSKAQVFVRLFGRTGTRIFYGLLGTAILVVGVLSGLGVIQESP